MANFCGKCGAPIDPATGLCTKCGPVPNALNPAANTPVSPHPTDFNIEKARAEQALKNKDAKAKRKAEKKQAWSQAKKRYNEDVAAKKAVLKKGKKERKKAKWDALSAGKKAGRILLKIALVLLLIGAIVVGGYFAVTNLFADSDTGSSGSGSSQTTPTTPNSPANGNDGSINVYNPPTDSMPDEYKPVAPNADEYFQQNSEIISTIPAAGAGRTEQEAYANLTGRGFTSITTEYTMDGVYSEAKEISATGTEKHPLYTATFMTESGDAWTIYEINGAVFAYPVTYNYEHLSSVPVLISESEKVVSYDSTLNKFYETTPAESALDVKIIPRIDAATLNTLNVEEVE